MSSQAYIYVGIWLVGAIFGAGVSWGMVKATARQLRKEVGDQHTQLNGVGAKVRALENEVRDKYTTTCLAVMATANALEDGGVSLHIGEILNDPARGK